MIEKGAIYEAVPAVTDGNLITGRGPAFTINFALEIVKAIRGEEIAEKVKKGLLL